MSPVTLRGDVEPSPWTPTENYNITCIRKSAHRKYREYESAGVIQT